MPGTNSAILRVIHSPYQPTDVDTETADLIGQALDGGQELRRCAADLTGGRPTYLLQLLAYTDPEGVERYAVVHDRPEGREVFDSTDQEVAEAQYVEEAEAIQECGGHWDVVDVPGIARAGYAFTVEHSIDGGATWKRREYGEGSLSREADPDTTVGDVARRLGERDAESIERDNQVAALNQAVGSPFGGPGHIDALRVTVTQDGAEVASWRRDFAPYEPTDAEVVRWREVIAAEPDDVYLGHLDQD